MVNQLGNLTLLERKLNHLAGSKPFVEKRSVYKQSSFVLTKSLGVKRSWKVTSVETRIEALADLACIAWPAS